MWNFEDKLLDWIQSQRLFEGVGRVLLAVSGGADSAAMAVAVHRLRADGRSGAEPVIGHVNHGLRGAASDADEAYVKGIGERQGVRVACRRVDVRGMAAAERLSLETAGRVLRIQALVQMARENGCDAVATGHHGDDQAETVVHRLMRGTGLRGLCGIRPAATLEGMRFLRPMLSMRRAEIEAYCRAMGLAWREDASNRSCVFTRNRIRHRLMPELEKLMPNAAEKLAALAEECRAAQERIEPRVESGLCAGGQKEAVEFERAVFVRLSPWVQAEMLGRAVEAVGGGFRDITSRHYQTLMALAGGQTQSKRHWPAGVVATVERERIIISKPAGEGDVLPREPVRLEMGKAANFGPYRVETALLSRSAAITEAVLRDKTAMTERLDADCIEGPLVLRKQEPGDRFWPIGLGWEKKAARFLLDSTIEQGRRKSVFVVADARKILWLAPVRLDERVKVTSKTRQILEIRIAADNTVD